MKSLYRRSRTKLSVIGRSPPSATVTGRIGGIVSSERPTPRLLLTGAGRGSAHGVDLSVEEREHPRDAARSERRIRRQVDDVAARALRARRGPGVIPPALEVV